MRYLICALMCLFLLESPSLYAQRKKKGKADTSAKAEKKEKNLLKSSLLNGFKFRAIGPALTSGRISDFAVNPQNPAEYYVAVSSGGVWKTTNSGTTYKPIFDSQGSYSIGVVEMAPSNPHTIWVGTGENNGQRSIAYGDGVYKSLDGGKSWKNMGLKESEHIGKILIDPRDEQTVFVAAQGPLWSTGGQRGLYKTTDGGETWDLVLKTSEHTGVNEVFCDPRNPDIMYANTWQRARKVWTFLGGGPESAIYKSIDGGETWFKSQKGLPGGDIGRIGMAVSPVNPDILYAILEAQNGGGFYRSSNRGGSWEKMSSQTTSSNYYQEIIADPHDVDRVYAMNTWNLVTNDGGKTFTRLGENDKHVDNHCLWVDPKNPSHYLAGCDGGIYETWDKAKTWDYKPNLSITQFYKVATDNATPFYNVYGGTQDNFSLGGPSRTTSNSGIVNSDWFVTNGGDGFESQIDPTNPNIVYAQAQYGWLVRYDKLSGERINIQPQPGKGEPGLRWNWDAPLQISPHKNTRLYFSANKVFKSEDRGDTWEAISPDLSRQLDRNTLEVMGKVWSMDAVAKNRSTSIYGNIVAFHESPRKEGLLYVGTDDGLIQISDNTGKNWNKIEDFPGIPPRTYVNMVLASQHEDNTVYAVFNNHKNGDFAPYILKSSDRGTTWNSITGNLPKRGSVYCIAEDHVNPNLLFAGTEFGLFVSIDAGKNWMQMKSGLPTIAIRDMEIQKRENDLVLASFGRGFYVLDNYAPLRELSEELLEKDAHMFAIKDALMFIESSPIGGRGKSAQGSSYFTTPNPPVAATFTYYLKDSPKTQKQQRKEAEKKAAKEGKSPVYPSFEAMRAEDKEEKPYLLFTITDAQGDIVNRLKTSSSKGLKRMTWNFRYPSTNPIRVGGSSGSGRRSRNRGGQLALPGQYAVSLSRVHRGEITELIEPQKFNVVPLNNKSLPAKDQKELFAFQEKVSKLNKAVGGARALYTELDRKLKHFQAAVEQTPTIPISKHKEINALKSKMEGISLKLNGDPSVSRRQFETAPSISSRVSSIIYGMYSSTSAPTTTMKQSYSIAADEFTPVYEQLKGIVTEVRAMEEMLEKNGAPYTPGRLPNWRKE